MIGVVERLAFPWALGMKIANDAEEASFTSFINMNGLDDAVFDYTLQSGEFDACGELQTLPYIKLINKDRGSIKHQTQGSARGTCHGRGQGHLTFALKASSTNAGPAEVFLHSRAESP